MKRIRRPIRLPHYASAAILLAGVVFMLWLAVPSADAWLEIARHLFNGADINQPTIK
jgi:hypothetical protein